MNRNKSKWAEFESALKKRGSIDPDRRAELYLELTDDLSFARTHFPNSKTTEYLNGLTAQFHQSIYQNRKEDRDGIVNFYKYELPRMFYEHFRELLLAFVIFVGSVGVGILSSKYDTTFVRLVMGDGYVNMTEENIANDDPLAVYKDQGHLQMFLGITINNLRVAFLTFVAGVLFSIGTVYILFSNGVMVGSFFYMFYDRGLLAVSSGIWIHGALELSAIVIAGCAGLVMGNSLIFPGTYPRMHSFRQGARKGLKIMMALIPVFIVAGFIESFITRHYQYSHLMNGTIIILSFAFIIWYFIIYPIQLNKNGQEIA